MSDLKQKLNKDIQDRFDRQNRTYGKEATTLLTSSNVTIIGLSGGIATEVSKNLVLSGVLNLTLIKDGDITSSDLNCGIYYNNNSVGKLRHVILSDELKKLNPYVNINFSTLEDLEWDNNLIITCNKSFDENIKISEYTRKNNCKFVSVTTRGMSGLVFVDGLENHLIRDPTGETYDIIGIESITKEGVVTCLNVCHDLQDNDSITFKNLDGVNLDFLEKNWKVKVIDKSKFLLNDFPNDVTFNFVNGGIIFVKESLTMNFFSYVEQVKNPSVVGINQENDLEIINLYKFLDNQVLDSDSWSESMNSLVTSYDDKNISKLIRSMNIEIAPVVSVIGSLGSMEVIKLITNKFTPVNQWMVFSDLEMIPDSKPTNCDNIGLGNLFGSKFKDNIEMSNLLMVGCGAIGCEMLKNLSKLNVSSKGVLTVTDPDHIEKSNLSRQFLFTNESIGKSKSEVACNRVKEMNENMNLIPLVEKMSEENLSLCDNLLEETTGVINALDNVQARKFMDSQCFRFGKPLFESGTQGMKGNTQPVIPFVTECYGDSVDPPQEKSFPVCTIKNFPSEIHHTIHWAMDTFELFKRGPENVNKYIENPDFLDELSGYDRAVAKSDIYDYLVKYSPDDWKDCVRWASDLFLSNYRDQIIQILHNFPIDSLNKDGSLFWSKGKRCPKILNFDLSNEMILEYIDTTARLLCECCNIEDKFTEETLKEYLSTYDIYEYQIDKKKKIAKNDSEQKDLELKEDNIVLPGIKTTKIFNIQTFEKDDDTNYHVKFIMCSSNLRAINYNIKPADFDTTKGIAGKIIPAVATTTSIVAGLISIELMKWCYYKDKSKTLDRYRSTFVNLSNCILVSSTPIEAKKLKFGTTEINAWTKFVVTTDLTLEEFIKSQESKFDTELSMIVFGSSIIYANFMPCVDKDKKLSKIFEEKYNINIFKQNIELVIAPLDDSVELPPIQINLKDNNFLNLN